MKKLLLAVISLSLFLSAAPAAFAGDCQTRDEVNWHATISSSVYVRTDCPGGDPIAVVPAGEVVQILEVDRFNEFYLIKTSVGTGFVFNSFLTDITMSPMPGTETYPNSIFIDLNPKHEYYEEIAYMKENGIVNGNPQGEINADASINRAELAKILIESTVDDSVISNSVLPAGTYSDVEAGAWYLPYLKVARDRNILVGDSGKTTVRPADGVNGAEVSKMIAEALDLEIPAPQSGEQWYQPYMNELNSMGALPFSSPTHQVTRGEMMRVMFVVMNELASQAASEEEIIEEENEATGEAYVELLVDNDNWYGDVWYYDGEGDSMLVYKSETVANGYASEYFDEIYLTDALLSPDGRFVVMPATCWETHCAMVYAIEGDAYFWTNIASANYSFTDEGYLRVEDNCEEGVDDPYCLEGDYESYDLDRPWELQLVGSVILETDEISGTITWIDWNSYLDTDDGLVPFNLEESSEIYNIPEERITTEQMDAMAEAGVDYLWYGLITYLDEHLFEGDEVTIVGAPYQDGGYFVAEEITLSE